MQGYKIIMKSYYSIENKIIIELVHDQDITADEELILRAYVPGIKKYDNAPEEIDLSVVYNPSPEFAHKLYGLVRLELLKKKLFCVHSVCVNLGKRVLVVGHSGSGKTTVARELMNKGGFVESGNKTMVSWDDHGKLLSHAGTSVMSFKNTDIIPNQLENNNQVRVWDRVIVDMPYEKVNEHNLVDSIVVIRLNNYKNTSNQLVGNTKAHKLYPYFMDAVNADVLLDSKNDVLVSQPPAGTEHYLADNLRNLKIPVYTIEGTLEYICETIEQL